ncbi:DoxX family protein [uncultured Methylobacterium sp.]|uniref:DoxX family protein n=1 Tax=uncultured Methylobacterium sp. TaxID=157278 RepID=UPI0035C97FB8
MTDRTGAAVVAEPPGRIWLRRALIVLYGVVGAVHLAAPGKLMPIMPAWVPEPRLVILATGLCEIAGALALLSPRLRRAAGIGLALYALCVWPANIKQAWEGIPVEGLPDSWWYHGPRLAFQPVLIWAGLFAGGAIDWPFGGTRKGRAQAADGGARPGPGITGSEDRVIR